MSGDVMWLASFGVLIPEITMGKAAQVGVCCEEFRLMNGCSDRWHCTVLGLLIF
jgi:hypothetical protein